MTTRFAMIGILVFTVGLYVALYFSRSTVIWDKPMLDQSVTRKFHSRSEMTLWIPLLLVEKWIRGGVFFWSSE